MTYTKSTLAVGACAVMASGASAFMIPSARVSMTAQQPKSNAKASAAAVLAAGVLLQGAVAAPVSAEAFESATPATTIERSVGFDMPQAAKDAKNNNAASGKVNGDKYSVKQLGSFAKENSKGAVDYGSPKGTDFGDLAGGAKGVATNQRPTQDGPSTGSGSSQKSGSNPAAVAAQKARKLAEQGVSSGGGGSFGGSSAVLSARNVGDATREQFQAAAKNAGKASDSAQSVTDTGIPNSGKANIKGAVELGKQSPSLGGGSNWGNTDIVSNAAKVAKDTTVGGRLSDAIKDAGNTWTGKGNAFSTPIDQATKTFDKVQAQRTDDSDVLGKATAAVKQQIEDVNQGSGDQYKQVNRQ